MSASPGQPRVLVVGLGAMGRGIARVFAGAGAEVAVTDATASLTEEGLERLLEEAAADGEEPRIAAAGTLAEGAAGADLVIEAVVEDVEVKRDLFARVGEVAGEQTIVASNTSSLSIGELAQAFADPARVAGAHFFNPPTKMRLVEIVRGPATSAETVDRLVAWAELAGKSPIVCEDSPNFIVNRVCRPLYMEAQLLVSQGVEPAAVDAVARHALGHRMGPLELLDFVGLHVNLASSETAYREFGDPRYRPIPLLRRLVRGGLTGRARGRGYYDYASEKPKEARARVTVAPPAGGETPPAVAGPGADRLLERFGGERLRPEPAAGGAGPLLYACGQRVEAADVEAVARERAAGRPLAVDAADGRWIEALPAGAGWLRLHGDREAAFAEVVNDPVAGIARNDAVTAVLAALETSSVDLPALPGLVADRLRQTMTNEATLLLEERVAAKEAIDMAMRLGMNHPEGPLEYLDRVRAGAVVDGLRAMLDYTGEPRYRPTLLLCREAGGEAR